MNTQDPLQLQFPELNANQLTKLRKMLQEQYDKGVKDTKTMAIGRGVELNLPGCNI